jgi:GntR family transcriptional repressor for pyruvate dehydrogenase complex
MILEGALKPATRLPAERELANRMNVSRNSLREALQDLAARGLIETKPGGGRFVAKNAGSGPIGTSLEKLFRDRPDGVFEVLEMRRLLEGEAAAMAARRATDEDLIILTERFEALEQGYAESASPGDNAERDLDFHLAIGESAHNLMLIFTMRNVYKLLLDSIRDNLDLIGLRDGSIVEIESQHRGIYEAVLARDSEAAREAAFQHIDYVDQRLHELATLRKRRDNAMRRLYGFESSC